jgi:hypothetical protein
VAVEPKGAFEGEGEMSCDIFISQPDLTGPDLECLEAGDLIGILRGDQVERKNERIKMSTGVTV